MFYLFCAKSKLIRLISADGMGSSMSTAWIALHEDDQIALG